MSPAWDQMRPADVNGPLERSVARRRLAVVAAVLGALLIVACAAGPFLKSLTTEWYADSRPLLGVPNFLNVVSNLPFLLVGVAGLVLCLRTPRTAPALPSWAVFYAGMVLTCFGSAFYHLAPSDATIVWDRLGMVVAFVGLAAAVIAESARIAIPTSMLAVALLCGALSVLWWRASGDLRIYAWVQLAPLACAATALVLRWLPPRLARLLGASLALYVLAKLAETFDARVYELTVHALSGHTLKHLLAAASAAVLLLWQWHRGPQPS
ncbi:MAG TPA: hypothetical protein VNX02_15850 [Steroidobacteraceae bacterium]|jgi:hypothetical protein|nr:hypothetical protein [Steroidobacteraceae bacterium]